MLFLTSTTIKLIASVLMFLTNNTLCLTTHQANKKNNPGLQNFSQDNQDNRDRNIAAILKNMSYFEIEMREDEMNTLNEEYKKLQKPGEKEKVVYEYKILDYEIIIITLGKEVLQLKKYFTNEKYEKFLKHVDDIIENLKKIQSKKSPVLADEEKKIISDDIKQLLQIPERSEEIFTVGVVGKEEKERVIKIIKEVKKSRKNTSPPIKNATSTGKNNTPTGKNISSGNKESENKPTRKNSPSAGKNTTSVENIEPESNIIENKPSKNKSSLTKVLIWVGVILGALLLGLLIVIFKLHGD